MSEKYLTHEQIVERLKALYNAPSDSALSEVLGVSRQSLWQFKKGRESDIKIKIISNLLEGR